MHTHTQSRRVGVFDISWNVLHKDTVGVVAAFRDLLVIGALSSDTGIRYCAISLDQQFDTVPVDATVLPEYELRMGINADGSRTHRWVKK